MQYITEFISLNYLTLTVLIGIAVVQIANRKTKIEGVQYIWFIEGLVFLLTVLNYLDLCVATHHFNGIISYLNASVSYCIYPLIALLELYLIVPMKRKLILTIPYFLFCAIEIADFFGAKLTYSFTPESHFVPGLLRPLPIIMDSIYIIILTVLSLLHFRHLKHSKRAIVIFMACSTIITAYLEYRDIVTGIVETIIAFDVVIYYVYLAAIQQSETQRALHRKEIELEKSKLELFMAQIKPHYINNALLAIREVCYDNAEEAAELIEHFARYLRDHFTAMDSDALIPFSKEIDAIKEYLMLEYADKSKKFTVSYELSETDFSVPALTVEPMVENAVKHGIDRYSPDSKVILRSYANDSAYIIEIRDNGKGFEVNAETLGKSGIGLKNAQSRLQLRCRGTLQVSREDNWTVITITIPKEDTECIPSQSMTSSSPSIP